MIFLFLSLIIAETYRVPSEFETIQSAIDFTSYEGDTIIVSPGTYVENINYMGKDIYLTSHYIFTEADSTTQQTIIDGNQNGTVVSIENGESRHAV